MNLTIPLNPCPPGFHLYAPHAMALVFDDFDHYAIAFAHPRPQKNRRFPHPSLGYNPYLQCEDCGLFTLRCKFCPHTGLLLCDACYFQKHYCEPKHDRDTCKAYSQFLQYGLDHIRSLRAENHQQSIAGSDASLLVSIN